MVYHREKKRNKALVFPSLGIVQTPPSDEVVSFFFPHTFLNRNEEPIDSARAASLVSFNPLPKRKLGSRVEVLKNRKKIIKKNKKRWNDVLYSKRCLDGSLIFFQLCRVNLIAHTIGISISWIDETHLNSMLLCIFFSYFFVGVRGHTQLSRPVRRYMRTASQRERKKIHKTYYIDDEEDTLCIYRLILPSSLLLSLSISLSNIINL